MKPQTLAFILSAFLVGCSTGNIDFGGLTGLFSNQGTIGSGATSGNVQTMDIDLDQMEVAGDRVLTKEELIEAKSAYEKGMRDARNMQSSTWNNYGGARIHYVMTGGSVSNKDMLEKFPKLGAAHPHVQEYITRLYNMHSRMVVGEVLRSPKRQKRLKAKGVSWTLKSKHIAPYGQVLAVDLVPIKNKKVDYNDIHSIFYIQGLGAGLGKYLGSMPCSIFALEPVDVFGWRYIGKRIIDGYHHEFRERAACVGQAI